MRVHSAASSRTRGLPRRLCHQYASVRNDFDCAPFWAGDRVEWMEGKIKGAAISTAEGKPYSSLKLSRNIQSMVEALGSQRIASGQLPADASKAIGDSNAAVTYVGGIGDIYNASADTYVIHRADRDI